MLNMLLAIVMDVYATVKDGMDEDAETIWSQIYEIFRRWREKRLGLRCSLGHVQRELRRHRGELRTSGDEPRLLTVTLMCELVDGMRQDQATRILTHSETLWSKRMFLRSERSLSHAIRSVDLRVQRLQQSLETVDGTTQQLAALTDAVDGLAFDELEHKASASNGILSMIVGTESSAKC